MGWLFLFGFGLGAVLGSFVKALSDRYLKKVSFWGRSYCESCKKQLKWYDLFPVFSYLVLKGKCRFCRKKIPLGNFITEIVLGLIIAFLFGKAFLSNPGIFNNFDLNTALFCLTLFSQIVVIVILALVFLTDLRTGLIPDQFTYPGVMISVIYLLASTGLASWIFYQNTLHHPLGKYFFPPYSSYFLDVVKRYWISAAWSIGGAILASLFFVLLILLTKGKGMGWGDVKYVLFLGLSLGYPKILLGLFLAFLLGAIGAVFLIILGKKHFGQTIPFGPFLSLGALIALFFGPQILNWYLNGFRLN